MTQNLSSHFKAVIGSVTRMVSKNTLAVAIVASLLVAGLSNAAIAQGFDMGGGWSGNVGL